LCSSPKMHHIRMMWRRTASTARVSASAARLAYSVSAASRLNLSWSRKSVKRLVAVGRFGEAAQLRHAGPPPLDASGWESRGPEGSGRSRRYWRLTRAARGTSELHRGPCDLLPQPPLSRVLPQRAFAQLARS